MSTFTEEELAGLTPGERAALSEPDDPSERTATVGDLEAQGQPLNAAAQPEKTDDQDKNGDADAGAGAADVPAAAAAQPAAAQPAAADAEPAAAPSAPAQQAPLFVAQAPEDAEARLAKIADDKKALIQKYDDGDITLSELEAQREKLDDERLEIKTQINTAQIAFDMEQQRLKNQWDADCNSFLAKNDVYKDGELLGQLNETVIAFAKMPRNAGLDGPALLEKAHRALMAERGTPVAAQPVAQQRAIPKPTLPPDISRLPAASSNDPGEGRFANLDRLADTNPAGFEAALAALSEADRDAYLAQ